MYRDDPFEVGENAENEDDITASPEDFQALLVAPADWTVGTIYSQIGKQIDLDPAFQRRNVWPLRSKSRFIESLFLGIPIPQILLSDKKDKKGAFIVLDGKQRLITIFEFLSGTTLDGTKFRLRGLRIMSNIEGKAWDEIREIDDLEDQLLNETLRTTIVKNWNTQPVLYEIFYRLNSGSFRLSPMELRMSLYPGNFLKMIIAWSEVVGPIHELLRKKRPDKRMGDVELAARFLAFRLSPDDYAGNLKEFLDNFCDFGNNNYDHMKHIFSDNLDTMNRAIILGMEIFPNQNFCRKYSREGYGRPFNRAIFDILVGSLSDQNFYQYASDNKDRVRTAYEELCVQNYDFIRSVETSTKTKDATLQRFSTWYRVVREMSGIILETPRIAPR